MKNLIALMLMLVSSYSFSASMGKDYSDDNTGIVTPNIATGVLRTRQFAVDTNGNLVYCPPNFDHSERKNTCTLGERNGWTLLKDAVPVGKTYVGFKSVSGYYGYQYIEIYWK